MKYNTEYIKEALRASYNDEYTLISEYMGSYRKVQILNNNSKEILLVSPIDIIKNKELSNTITKQERTIELVHGNAIVAFLEDKNSKFKFHKLFANLELDFNKYKVINSFEADADEFRLQNKDKISYLDGECFILEETFLTQNQIKYIRDSLQSNNNNICDVCRKEIKLPVLDHNHTKRHNGTGYVRNAICNTCNRMIGVIENNFVKNGIDFSDAKSFLENMSIYIDRVYAPIIHPTEKTKENIVSKSNYNKLKKVCDNQKFPEYPKSKKLTLKLKKLFEIHGINPFN